MCVVELIVALVVTSFFGMTSVNGKVLSLLLLSL